MIHTIDLNFKGLPHSIASFLIPTEDGPILIETGPHSTLPYLQDGVNKLGYDLSEIKHVLLSHIHLDHAGAAWYLAKLGTKVYVHSRGYKHLKDPSRLMSSATRIYGDMMDKLWGSMEPISAENLVEVVDNQPISIGGKQFTPWYTPGHAVHHLAWQMDETLFTGDVAGVRIGNGPVMPPCPPPDIHIVTWVQSLDLIRELKLKRLYLTHYGLVTNINVHLDELEKRLIAWSVWIKPYWERQVPAEEVIDPFRQYVVKELAQSGLSKTEAAIYEAANPSWMSVYGLMRYWDRQIEK